MKDKIWLKSMQLLAPTCHQRVERSYQLAGYQLPVCARCQGLYIGYIISIFLYAPIFILFIPLTYIDGFIQLKTNYISRNITRLSTGIISGIATVQLIKIIIHYLIN